jgi:MFS family permease
MTEETSAPLAGPQIRTLVLAALGGALEFYDFIIFVFFTTIIGRLFFPPDTADWLRQLQTLGIFAAGYLARPLGGIFMAHFGDRSGRKRMFTLSVLLMAVPTLLIGLLPTYQTIGHAAPLALLVLRIAQGAAVGGEVPGAWTFVAEHVSTRRVGFACGTLTAGLTIGILFGSLIAAAINAAFSADDVRAWAWRVPFVIGGVFGLGAVFLRRLLSETPVFEAMQVRKELVRGMPLKAALAGHARAIVISMLLTWLLTAGILVVILLTPTLLQNAFAIAPARSLAANSVATFCLSLGCIAYGALCDRIGAARSLLIGSVILMATTYALYFGVARMPQWLFALYAIAGLAVGVVGVIPAILVQLFPPAVRFSGISFAYNVAYAVFGGLTTLLWPVMTKTQPFIPAHYVAALCVMGVGVSLMLPQRVAAGPGVERA